MMIWFTLSRRPHPTTPFRTGAERCRFRRYRAVLGSPAHARNLLRDAADMGLIQRSSGADNSEYVVLAPLAEATRKFFATMFLVVAASIAAAIEEIESTNAVRPK